MSSRHRIASIETRIAGHWLFVIVTTEGGIRGIGESTYFVHPNAAALIVKDLSEVYVGEDAFRAEFLQQRALKHHCLRDMASVGAVSAIDQALWDIKGKALQVPVWELFGGRVRDRVRAILLIEASNESELIDGARKAVADGFTAIKLKPFMGDWANRNRARLLKSCVDLVFEVRNELGWDVDIAVEIHRNLRPADAIEFAQMVREAVPYFLEDPILPFSVESNRYVASGMDAPVALAERNLNIWEFREYSDCHGVSILRPDIGSAGGFTQLRKIAAIAESRHQTIVPHNFTSPVVTACHVQMAACTSNWDVQGYVREDRSPWRDVVRSINVVRDGYIDIPETPGIGMELNEPYLEMSSYRPFGTAFGHGAPLGPDGAIKHQ